MTLMPVLGGERTGLAPAAAPIPVADALPVRTAASRRRRRQPRAARMTLRQRLMIVILLVVGWSDMQVLATGGTVLFQFGVLLRYALLPMIALAVALHIQRKGPFALLHDVAIVLPFFLIGALSGVLSSDPIGASRSLTFWLLGVLGAAVIAEEVPPDRVTRVLFWSFFGIAVLSIAVSIGLPSIGRSNEAGRVINQWRGVATSKNAFANYLIFAFVAGLLTKGVRLPFRIAMLCAVAVCLLFARSGGGFAQAAAIGAFLIVVIALRALPISRPLRSGLLVGILGAGMLIAFALISVVLELLGKDASFTGRTSVWPAYFDRALEYWAIGAGPGTFTQVSFVTMDLGSDMQDLGAIRTPHNMYIAAFGEVGLLGLIAFVGIFLYTAFLTPFARRSSIGVMAGAVAMATLVGGVSETREVFGTGMGMFLLILCSVAARRADDLAAVTGGEGVAGDRIAVPPSPGLGATPG